MGTEKFFEVVGLLRDALAGRGPLPGPAARAAYRECLRENAKRLYLGADYVLVHDVHPIGLVDWRFGSAPWIWRSHLDLSQASEEAWRYLRGLLSRYDAAIVSHSRLSADLGMPTHVIQPSIDPLHERNEDLPAGEAERIVSSEGVALDRPVALVVSRPEDVNDAAALLAPLIDLARKVPLRPVLLVVASAGLEGLRDSNEVRRRFGDLKGAVVVVLSSDRHRALNALGRAAAVCLQPLRHRGFDAGLLELLWKGKPVIAGPSAAGLVSLTHGKTGFVARSDRAAAACVARLLKDRALADRVGRNGRELVREHYLVTRHVRDYLLLMRKLGEARR
jgi:trehalose synthase